MGNKGKIVFVVEWNLDVVDICTGIDWFVLIRCTLVVAFIKLYWFKCVDWMVEIHSGRLVVDLVGYMIDVKFWWSYSGW